MGQAEPILYERTAYEFWNVHLFGTNDLEGALNAHARRGYQVYSVWSYRDARLNKVLSRVIFLKSFLTEKERDRWVKGQASRRAHRQKAKEKAAEELVEA
jgi:hypothetical protein